MLNRVIRVDHANEFKERTDHKSTEADDAKVARMAQAILQSAGADSVDYQEIQKDNSSLDMVQTLTEEEARRLRKQERRERETSEERRLRKERSKLKSDK